jgi:hypothetical protein
VAAVLPVALASGACPQLEVLGLVHCKLADNGALELVRALALASPSRMRSLDLAFNGVGPQGAAAVARWCLGSAAGPGCPAPLPLLEHLRLDGNPLGDAGLLSLVQALRQPRAAEATAAATAAGALYVAAAAPAAVTAIPETECAASASSPSAPSLRRLELRRVKLGRCAVQALAQALLAGVAPKLESLVLGTRELDACACLD